MYVNIFLAMEMMMILCADFVLKSALHYSAFAFAFSFFFSFSLSLSFGLSIFVCVLCICGKKGGVFYFYFPYFWLNFNDECRATST